MTDDAIHRRSEEIIRSLKLHEKKEIMRSNPNARAHLDLIEEAHESPADQELAINAMIRPLAESLAREEAEPGGRRYGSRELGRAILSRLDQSRTRH